MISPIDQYVHEIDFISLPTNKFPSNYISVTVLAQHYDPSSILLDISMVYQSNVSGGQSTVTIELMMSWAMDAINSFPVKPLRIRQHNIESESGRGGGVKTCTFRIVLHL